MFSPHISYIERFSVWSSKGRVIWVWQRPNYLVGLLKGVYSGVYVCAFLNQDFNTCSPCPTISMMISPPNCFSCPPTGIHLPLYISVTNSLGQTATISYLGYSKGPLNCNPAWGMPPLNTILYTAATGVILKCKTCHISMSHHSPGVGGWGGTFPTCFHLQCQPYFPLHPIINLWL